MTEKTERAKSIDRYFDWAATSPGDEEILRSALDESLLYFGNPSSVHKLGLDARTAFEQARNNCASALGVQSKNIFFTSGGTESDHIPLLSLLARPAQSSSYTRGTIIISGIEHPALREQASRLSSLGFSVITVNPDRNGFITPESICQKLTPDTLYITVMAVNNETGCIQPVYKIADAITESCKGKRRPHFHVDCVQAAGKIPIELSYKGIDSAALSAHKICGPRGIGILYLSREIEPFLTGGGQEKNIRSGTENLFGAIAFSKCLKKYWINEKCAEIGKNALQNDGSSHYLVQKKLTSNFIEQLCNIPSCTLVPPLRADLSAQEKFSPYVVQAAFKNIPGEVAVRALSAKGFYISTGSACSAKKQSRPILAAMKTPQEIQNTAVRFSFGPLTTEDGMGELLKAITEVASDFNK